jgi:hypothetical protein
MLNEATYLDEESFSNSKSNQFKKNHPEISSLSLDSNKNRIKEIQIKMTHLSLFQIH